MGRVLPPFEGLAGMETRTSRDVAFSQERIMRRHGMGRGVLRCEEAPILDGWHLEERLHNECASENLCLGAAPPRRYPEYRRSFVSLLLNL